MKSVILRLSLPLLLLLLCHEGESAIQGRGKQVHEAVEQRQEFIPYFEKLSKQLTGMGLEDSAAKIKTVIKIIERNKSLTNPKKGLFPEEIQDQISNPLIGVAEDIKNRVKTNNNVDSDVQEIVHTLETIANKFGKFSNSKKELKSIAKSIDQLNEVNKTLAEIKKLNYTDIDDPQTKQIVKKTNSLVSKLSNAIKLSVSKENVEKEQDDKNQNNSILMEDLNHYASNLVTVQKNRNDSSNRKLMVSSNKLITTLGVIFLGSVIIPVLIGYMKEKSSNESDNITDLQECRKGLKGNSIDSFFDDLGKLVSLAENDKTLNDKEQKMWRDFCESLDEAKQSDNKLLNLEFVQKLMNLCKYMYQNSNKDVQQKWRTAAEKELEDNGFYSDKWKYNEADLMENLWSYALNFTCPVVNDTEVKIKEVIDEEELPYMTSNSQEESSSNAQKDLIVVNKGNTDLTVVDRTEEDVQYIENKKKIAEKIEEVGEEESTHIPSDSQEESLGNTRKDLINVNQGNKALSIVSQINNDDQAVENENKKNTAEEIEEVGEEELSHIPSDSQKVLSVDNQKKDVIVRS